MRVQFECEIECKYININIRFEYNVVMRFFFLNLNVSKNKKIYNNTKTSQNVLSIKRNKLDLIEKFEFILKLYSSVGSLFFCCFVCLFLLIRT